MNKNYKVSYKQKMSVINTPDFQNKLKKTTKKCMNCNNGNIKSRYKN